MDLTNYMTPAVVVTVALAAIAFIVWLVRLEGKNSATVTAIEKIEKEIEKLELQLKVHESNQDIHFNKRIADAIEERDELRFKQMEIGIETLKVSMADIHRKLNHLGGRE